MASSCSWKRFGNTLNTAGLAGVVVHIDQRALEENSVPRHFEALWRVGDEAFDDWLDLPPQHTLVWPRESGVAQERGAAREDLFIRRLHMRVSADDNANATVEQTPERNLLRCGFGVDIDKDDVGL